MSSHFVGPNSRVVALGAAGKLAHLSKDEIRNLPYPPDVLPGGRDVATPYGSIRVFEWGHEDGEKVLFLHGISTPVIALGDLAHELAGKGYRVMLFDLFGRGYSDAPVDLPHDARLYTTQILLVLASSPLTGWGSFHLVGYSLGGCLAASFARYFPHRLRSLVLVAGSGLIRPRHVGWQSRLLYSRSGLLPEPLVRWLVRRRIRPAAADEPSLAGGPADIVAAESSGTTAQGSGGNGDASGGRGFDSASISKDRPHVSVSHVVRWQIDHHEGFIGAFLSTIRYAPIYAPQGDWEVLAHILAERRGADKKMETRPRGLEAGRVLMILGKDDPVVVPSETIGDAEAVLGSDGVEAVVLDAGHEVNIKCSSEVCGHIDRFIHSGRSVQQTD
ncbi:Alpha/Beta hydrolase protein [Truncatella angustata]|uniref:Alpha/Beta hydrolase protein n=1 Tax=Truncatella angustata TaxID=152316 RepID=A0A9P9A4T9_9PEZI|nr:Alpha/Beta hydrolase protein [Truncatella angustata]KAH6660620.1 Alpha/Beta hydrolase protein [Truncatella angustata]